MKNFLKGLQIGLGFFLVVSILGVFAYLGIKARTTTNSTSETDPLSMYVGTNETLKSSKWNSLVSTAYYPKYAYKDRTGDFTLSTASTRYTDTAMNTDIAVEKGDLVLVMVSGNFYNNTSGKSTLAKIVLVSGDGTMIDSNASSIGEVWRTGTGTGTGWSPFALSAFIKANSTGTLTVGYQGEIDGGGGTFRAIKLKAIVVGKTN